MRSCPPIFAFLWEVCSEQTSRHATPRKQINMNHRISAGPDRMPSNAGKVGESKPCAPNVLPPQPKYNTTPRPPAGTVSEGTRIGPSAD